MLTRLARFAPNLNGVLVINGDVNGDANSDLNSDRFLTCDYRGDRFEF